MRTLMISAALLFGACGNTGGLIDEPPPPQALTGQPDLGPTPDQTPTAPKPDLTQGNPALACNANMDAGKQYACPYGDGVDNGCTAVDTNPCTLTCPDSSGGADSVFTRVLDDSGKISMTFWVDNGGNIVVRRSPKFVATCN